MGNAIVRRSIIFYSFVLVKGTQNGWAQFQPPQTGWDINENEYHHEDVLEELMPQIIQDEAKSVSKDPIFNQDISQADKELIFKGLKELYRKKVKSGFKQLLLFETLP